MSERKDSLHAEHVGAPRAHELCAQFDELDLDASFASSHVWCRAAAASLGGERLVHVALRDDARAVVGLMCLERSRAGWRSGSPGRPCLRWPEQELGYRYAPRWDPSFPTSERGGWLSALRRAFPNVRIELRRTRSDALPEIAAEVGSACASIGAGTGTWRREPVGDPSTYLASLRGKHRRDLAKYRRDIESSGGEWIECDGSEDRTRSMLAECFELHEGRLAEKRSRSGYSARRGRRFVAALVAHTRGQELRLSLLRCQGRLAAGCLAFVHRRRYWAWMSGWDRAFARLDLGRQVIYHQILCELEVGLSEIDLLGGDLVYKREFGLEKEPTLDIVICPDGASARRAALVAGALGLYRSSRERWQRRPPLEGRR